MMSATSFSGLAPRGTGTQAQTVVWIIYHMKKSSDGCFITEQSWDSEDIPRRIILMNGHLDAGFMAGWHDCFQKILQIFPQFFFGHRAIRFKKFIQFCHSLRFPSGKCLSVKIFQNIGSHFFIVILYFAFS